jgi:hypothetical protein
MTASIPVYRPDGSLYASVNESRLDRLVTAGLIARIVRHRKGHVNRAILFGRPEDPTPPLRTAYQGTKYSYLQQLTNGLRCWQHRKLNLRDENGEPVETRCIFRQVVEDCVKA